jgi:hypothetical protein
MVPELHCPWCGSNKIFLVSRIANENDKLPSTFYDIFYRYRCDDCKKIGPEFRNSTPNAWNAFSNKQE